jgi:hypothetical protein
MGTGHYVFVGGYPTPDTIARAYDEADLNRAMQAYRFFYPTVSGNAIIKGNAQIGVVDNTAFGTLDCKPQQIVFTANSDTPYGPMSISLEHGPMVVELPPGPLIVCAMDVNQRWVADMGIPGPDAGKGGKHLLLPPDYDGEIPDGYHVAHATSYHVIIGARSLPVDGDVKDAMALLPKIKTYPLNEPGGGHDARWIDMSGKDQDTTPLEYETTFKFWEALNDVIQKEPAYEPYRNEYGELAVLGIVKGKPFKPDARMKRILGDAAVRANAQLRVESFADRRPDRLPWPDRQWEWAALRFENGDFEGPTYADLDARDKWFYQAIGASPAMFRRQAGQGSLYWLGLRDRDGRYLDGSKAYVLKVPQPVPAKLFWSVTVYDAETRSQIKTDTNAAALRSLFELKDLANQKEAPLYFGPVAPAGHEKQWIKTIPGKGWFVYFRIYGPEPAAFDGSWKPGDFETV